MKIITMGFLALGTATSFATSVIVTNGRGPSNTRSIVDNTGASVVGFGGFGIIDEAGIMGENTVFVDLGFQQYGNGGGSVSTSSFGQFSFNDNLDIDGAPGAPFKSQNVYLLVGFGGSDLETSTSLFIYKFDKDFGAAESGEPITAVLTATDSPGTTLLGTEVGIGAGSGTFEAVLIPEPSSAVLLGLGGLGLLVRRKR